jgi:hypothetical protein
MNYFQNFLKKWNEKNPGTAEDIGKSASSFVEKIQSSFNYKDHLIALLLGQVQSGKTSQMLAAISCFADQGFKLFILLTSDDNKLHNQTYRRVLKYLGADFCVCSEIVDDRFEVNDLSQPAVLVLKKNSSILKTWNGILSSLASCRVFPGVIFDDEADTASLNTKVNQNDTSPINRLLDELGKISPSSIYVQVTATPQAILLQTTYSGSKPEIVHIFEPGKGYYGGRHFYGEESKCVKQVPENERETLLNNREIPPGLRDALLCFLANVIFLMDFRGQEACNFLIHPGVRTSHHEVADVKIEKLLKAVIEEAASGSELLRLSFAAACEDLRRTCPEFPPFEYFWNKLPDAANKIRRQILNSKELIEIDYEKGANILIGGNGTGRGITFSALQVVYYCRESRTPLADTLWQHSRIFGYDRYLETCRIFLPSQLLRIFQTLNLENDAMFTMLSEGIPAQSALYKFEGTLPARKNVIDREALAITVGGVDYFTGGISHRTTEELDRKIGAADREDEISLEEAVDLLSLIDPEGQAEERELDQYVSCFNSLKAAGYTDCRLIVRVDRDISKDSGTLLSPNDRQSGASITDKPVLTLYRVIGQTAKGWSGKPVWVPNVRFPRGKMFYSVDVASC